MTDPLEMDPEVTALFPWWAAAQDAQPDAARTRALAWLDGPYARVAAQARLFSEPGVQELFDVLRDSLAVESVPSWDEPVLMEAWLRGLVDGCAASIARRDSN